MRSLWGAGEHSDHRVAPRVAVLDGPTKPVEDSRKCAHHPGGEGQDLLVGELGETAHVTHEQGADNPGPMVVPRWLRTRSIPFTSDLGGHDYQIVFRHPPGLDVGGRTDRSGWSLAVPEGQLDGVAVEVAGPEESQPHGDLRTVREKNFVTQVCALSCVAHTYRRGKTAVESLHPFGTGRSNGHRHEVVDGKGEYDMHFGTR